mmetsp:Transcript_31775/g.73015  ORF Transcript_31775/g.73015 Transcript_31775/m.73015 type:complete len:121 (-) Transcript_31775:53-415(-)
MMVHLIIGDSECPKHESLDSFSVDGGGSDDWKETPHDAQGLPSVVDRLPIAHICGTTEEEADIIYIPRRIQCYVCVFLNLAGGLSHYDTILVFVSPFLCASIDMDEGKKARHSELLNCVG